MSVYKKGDRWAVRIDLERDNNGPRRRKYLGSFRTKKEAESAERAAITSRDRGVNLSPERITISQLLERWQADRAHRVMIKTADEDARKIQAHVIPTLGEMLLAKLGPAHIAELYAKLLTSGWNYGPNKGRKGLSPKTVRHVHGLLHAACAWAVQMQLASSNVMDAVRPPKVPKHEARALSDDEALRFLAAANETELGPLFALSFFTGARRGELLALKWDAVDFENATITIRLSLSETKSGGIFLKPPKSGRTRTVSLAPEAVTALRRQRVRQAQEKLAAGPVYTDQGYVFADAIGAPLVPSSVSDRFRKLAQRTKISTTSMHTARHTAATWLLAEGTDVRTVCEVLGHSAASTTLKIYAHAIPGAQAKAVAKISARLARASGS